MDWLHLDMVSPRTVFLVVVAVLAAWMLLKATKHLIFSMLFLLVGVAAIGYLTGVIGPADIKSAGGKVIDKASDGIDAASDKLKHIGDLGHKTSAGNGSETNPAYERHLEGKSKKP